MARIEYTVESDVPAEKVWGAITDFSDRRLKVWPGISPKFWQLHSQGDGWAECTEGTDMPGGGVWARERYEWSGNRIVATVQESNIFRSGTWTMTVDPLSNGGSRIHVVNDRHPKGRGHVAAIVMRLFGKRMLTKFMRQTLDILRSERAPAGEAQPSI